MSLLPTPSEEQMALYADLQWLRRFLESVEQGTPLFIRQLAYTYYCNVFHNAADPCDSTGQRARFIEWFGETGADEVIRPINQFMQSYTAACREAQKALPIHFDTTAERDRLIHTLRRLMEVMGTRDQGFILWPKPRTHPCF